jgi:hypothetical protein
MPYVRCPACATWTLRSAWRGDVLGTFTITCPACAVTSDIHDVPMRLRPPDHTDEERRAAALALRVAAAVQVERTVGARGPIA